MDKLSKEEIKKLVTASKWAVDARLPEGEPNDVADWVYETVVTTVLLNTRTPTTEETPVDYRSIMCHIATKAAELHEKNPNDGFKYLLEQVCVMPTEVLVEAHYKPVATAFSQWWWNQSEANPDQGYDKWVETGGLKKALADYKGEQE